MEKKLRLAIVDDHALTRDGVRLCLERRGGFPVVMEAADAHEAYRLIPQSNPDVIVLDWALPGDDGLAVIKHVRAQWPNIKIVVFTGIGDAQNVSKAMLAGAHAFVRKDNAGRELIHAVEMVALGRTHLSSEAATGLIAALREQDAVGALTERETIILRGIAEGRSYKQIGAQLGISAKSVEVYRARLAKKLKCASRAELVRQAVRAGLIAQ